MYSRGINQFFSNYETISIQKFTLYTIPFPYTQLITETLYYQFPKDVTITFCARRESYTYLKMTSDELDPF